MNIRNVSCTVFLFWCLFQGTYTQSCSEFSDYENQFSFCVDKSANFETSADVVIQTSSTPVSVHWTCQCTITTSGTWNVSYIYDLLNTGSCDVHLQFQNDLLSCESRDVIQYGAGSITLNKNSTSPRRLCMLLSASSAITVECYQNNITPSTGGPSTSVTTQGTTDGSSSQETSSGNDAGKSGNNTAAVAGGVAAAAVVIIIVVIVVVVLVRNRSSKAPSNTPTDVTRKESDYGTVMTENDLYLHQGEGAIVRGRQRSTGNEYSQVDSVKQDSRMDPNMYYTQVQKSNKGTDSETPQASDTTVKEDYSEVFDRVGGKQDGGDSGHIYREPDTACKGTQQNENQVKQPSSYDYIDESKMINNSSAQKHKTGENLSQYDYAYTGQLETGEVTPTDISQQTSRYDYVDESKMDPSVPDEKPRKDSQHYEYMSSSNVVQ